MYLINKQKNRIEKIDRSTFKQLGFKEREHLQEWIANNPDCLNEDLLIIQKEFDGFHDTHERLDLLALDKQGNLVIIENKLDDTGRNTVWQVLKYCSYCSTLNASEVINIFQQYLDRNGKNEKAEDVLEDYFETDDYKEKLNLGNSQRVMMVAAEFRKEVTSTVLWLMNYGLRIQCFKTTPYKLNEQLFLNLEQIIPMREAEEFIISMANKTRENIESQEELKMRHIIRKEFWTEMQKALNKVSQLYQNVSPSTDHWLSAGSGMSGVHYACISTNYCIRIELAITGKTQEENKIIFDELEKRHDAIEKTFGHKLTWERLSEKRMSRIKFEKNNVSIFNKQDWKEMIEFICTYLPKFENAFKDNIADLNVAYKKAGKIADGLLKPVAKALKDN
jgi:hypothetical protein